MKGYAFWHTDMLPRIGDDRPWTVGEERRMEGPITQFQRGYHSAADWLSALPDTLRHYGTVASVLEVWEPDINRYGIQVSRQCKLLAAVDASRELRLFAVECALRVLNRERHEGREPHSRFWDAVEAARGFLEASIAFPVPSLSSINSTCSCSSTASVPWIYVACSSIPAGASHSSPVWVSPSA